MNLFRSEEHVRRWPLFDPASEEGIMPLASYHELFSTALFRERVSPDYVLRVRDLRPEMGATLVRLTKGVPFWQPRPPA